MKSQNVKFFYVNQKYIYNLCFLFSIEKKQIDRPNSAASAPCFVYFGNCRQFKSYLTAGCICILLAPIWCYLESTRKPASFLRYEAADQGTRRFGCGSWIHLRRRHYSAPACGAPAAMIMMRIIMIKVRRHHPLDESLHESFYDVVPQCARTASRRSPSRTPSHLHARGAIPPSVSFSSSLSAFHLSSSSGGVRCWGGSMAVVGE